MWTGWKEVSKMTRARLKRAMGAGTVMAAVLGLGATCASIPDSPAEWTLEGGQTLADAYDSQSATVVLILDPSQCFTCANRKFGAETGKRLAELVGSMGPEQLVRVGDAVVDCDTGDDLLAEAANGASVAS